MKFKLFHWFQYDMSFPRRLKQFCVASLHAKYRSSGPEVFYKNGVLRNFAKFTGKHLWQGLFLNKVAERLCYMCFPVNFAKFLRTPFIIYRTPLVALSESSKEDYRPIWTVYLKQFTKPFESLFNCGSTRNVWFPLGSVKICRFHPCAKASW